MQADGGYTQSGGFDPGLAALIAALLSGGVTSYGYSKETRSATDQAAERLKGEYEARLRRAEGNDTKNAVLEAERRTIEAKLQSIQKDRDDLARRLGELKTKMESASGPALTFQTATPQALKAAIPKVVAGLVSKYPWLDNKDSISMLMSVLEYPTTYQAKLTRLTLPMFYTKQVQVVLQQIANKAKGGRRRRYRRRGGARRDDLENEIAILEDKEKSGTLSDADVSRLGAIRRELGRVEQEQAAREKKQDDRDRQAAFKEASEAEPDYDVLSALKAPDEPTNEAALTPPSPQTAQSNDKQIPSYEEFAAIYERAIRDSTSTAADLVKGRSDTARNKVARTAAGVLLEKLKKAVAKSNDDAKDSEFLQTQLEKTAEVTSKREALSEARRIDDITKELGNETLTSEDWAPLRAKGEARLADIKTKTKEYIDAVKAAKKAEKEGLSMTGPKFGLPDFKISVGNPFAPLAEKLKAAKTQAEVSAISRKESGTAVKYIKEIVAEAEKVLNEIETLKQARAEGAIQAKDNDDDALDELARKMSEILDVGVEISAEQRTPGLKSLLAKLNTGVLSGVADRLRAAVGSDTYNIADALQAGELYVQLRPLLKEAVEKLRGKTAQLSKLKRFGLKTRRVATSAATGTRRAITGLRELFAALLGGLVAIFTAVSRRARAKAAGDARRDAEVAGQEAVAAAGEVVAQEAPAEEAVRELEERAAAPETSEALKASIAKLIAALKKLLSSSKTLKQEPPPPPDEAPAEAQAEAPPGAAPAAEDAPPGANDDDYAKLGLSRPPPPVSQDDIHRAHRKKSLEVRRGKSPEEYEVLLRELNTARDNLTGVDAAPFEYVEEAAEAVGVAAAEVKAADPGPEMKALFEKLAPLFAAVGKASSAAAKARSFLKQFAQAAYSSPKRVQESITAKFKATLKAYERRKERAEKVSSYKKFVSDELARLAEEEARLTKLEGAFRGTMWNIADYNEEFLASVNLDNIPSWETAGSFLPGSIYESATDEQKRKIYEAGVRIFKAKQALKDLKSTETFKAFQESPSLFKSTLTDATEQEYMVRRSAYEYRFDEQLKMITDTAYATGLNLLASVGIQEAVNLRTQDAKKLAKPVEGEAEVEEPAVEPAAEPAAEPDAPPAPKDDKAAKKAEAKAASDAKKAEEKRKKEEKAALDEIDGLLAKLEKGTAVKPAVLKAALAKNAFLKPVAGEAAASVESDLLTPLQNEVESATSQFEDAKARRTGANTKEERVELDRQIEQSRSRLTAATAKLEEVKATVPEKTFEKAVELAKAALEDARSAATAAVIDNPMLQPKAERPPAQPKGNPTLTKGLSTFFGKRASPYETAGREDEDGVEMKTLDRGVSGRFYRSARDLAAPEVERRAKEAADAAAAEEAAVQSRLASASAQPKLPNITSRFYKTGSKTGGGRTRRHRKARKSTLKKRRGGK